MNVKEFYDSIGGDYEDAVNRFGNDDIIKLFLKKYPSDTSFAAFITAVNNGDHQSAFLAAHTLKGVTGSMAFMELYNLMSTLVEKLRLPDYAADEAAVKKAEEYQARILSSIEKL